MSSTDFTELTLELLAGRVAALEAAAATPRDDGTWPGAVPRLIPRALFEEGDRLRDRYFHLVARLRELRRERQRIDDRWEALDARLRAGRFGDGTVPAPNAERLEAHKADAAQQRAERTAESREVERELEGLERQLRARTAVEVRGVRLPSPRDP